MQIILICTTKVLHLASWVRVFRTRKWPIVFICFFLKGFLNSGEYLALYEACELKRTGEQCGITLCCAHVFVCKRKVPKIKIIELLSKNATVSCSFSDSMPYAWWNPSSSFERFTCRYKFYFWSSICVLILKIKCALQWTNGWSNFLFRILIPSVLGSISSPFRKGDFFQPLTYHNFFSWIMWLHNIFSPSITLQDFCFAWMG